jgi:hypothetical protein
VLQSDSTGILQRLLKYPPVEDIRVLTSMAKRYQSYILGGCVTAKPSVLPQQVLTPSPISFTSDRSAPVLFTSLMASKKPTPLPAPNPLQEPISHSPLPSLPALTPLSVPTEPRRSKFDRAISLLQDQLSRGSLVTEEVREALELLRQVKKELRL